MIRYHQVLPLPQDAPQKGEIYAHFKTGNRYGVVGVALSSEDEWVVVYEPLYAGAIAGLFTRPCSQWRTLVEWKGEKVPRFTKVADR